MAVAWCEAFAEKRHLPVCRCDAVVMMLVFGRCKHGRYEAAAPTPRAQRHETEGAFTTETRNHEKYETQRFLFC
jgi:hypothetical protein